MPGIPLHFVPSLDVSSEFTPCSSTSPSCKSNIHSTKYMETSSKTNTMQEVCSTNHVLCGEDNEVSLKCQKKKSLIQNVWNNVDENLVQKSKMILSKMNSLPVKIMDNDIIDSQFFENSMEYKKQSTDKPCDYKIQEKKSDIMNMADKDLQSLDTLRSFLIDHEAIWAYYEDENYQIDEIKNIGNLTETMGSNNISKNNKTIESHTSCIREMKESNSTDNSCPMDIECTDNDKEKLEKNKEEIFHYNINTNEDASMNTESFCIVSEPDVPQLVMDFTEEIPMSTRVFNACQKVWKSMSNPFRSIDRDSEIAAKRSKLDIGRKFKPSDVNQTSHCKQHISYDDLDIKIQDNHETCQNVEDYHTIQANTSLSCKPSGLITSFLHHLDDVDSCDVTDDTQAIKCTVTSRLPHLSDFLSMRSKLCIREEIEQEAAKFLIEEDSSSDSSMSEESEESEDSEDSESQTSSQDILCKNSLLLSLSDNSTDSEDSFCILFESELKVGSIIDSDDSDSTDQDSEDDLVINMINEDSDESSEKSTQARKVLKKKNF